MKLSLFTFIHILVFSIAQAQFVTTFVSDPTMRIDDAMILDRQGNLYGSHYMGSNVYKVTPTGTVSTFAGGFNTPNGLAFDSQDNLFICDNMANRIYKLSYTGAFLDTFSVNSPSGIIRMPDNDTMIFTQYGTDKLAKLAPDGSIVQTHNGAPLNGPVGLAYDDSGNLFMSNFDNREIYKVETDTLLYIARLPGSSSNWLGFITYGQGSLWASGFYDDKIYRVYENFIDSVSVFAGSTAGNDDGHASVAKFNAPNGITASSTGDTIYVSDYNSGRVRLIWGVSTTGIFSHDTETINLSIFPNPSEAFVNINYNSEYKEILILDANGRSVYSTTEKRVDISEFSAGMYFVKVISMESQALGKFIKQ